jgi:cytochrome b561
MPLRSGDHGYGSLAKSLHWLTVVALIAQFLIGYRLDVDDSGRGRGRGRGGDNDDSGRGRGRGRGGDDDGGYLTDPDTLLTVHVLLGVLIVTLAVARVVVRRLDGLPPWAETLSHRERTLAHWTEKALLLLLFVVPLTGIVLVASGDDDVLPLHVAAHVAFFVALASHLGLVLKHQLVDRDRLLARMLP